MRQIWLNRDDFEMFHQDISPLDYEFFRTHVDTFKRMWKEQVKMAHVQHPPLVLKVMFCLLYTGSV